jgi:starch synthase
LDSVTLLDRPIDLIHCNDWQCGLIPAFSEVEYSHTRGYEALASLFTIHNMAYQGVFWHWDMLFTGLDWRYFNWRQMEFHGKLNLLKTGLVFANAINTVSQRYSEEICEPPWDAVWKGCSSRGGMC